MYTNDVSYRDNNTIDSEAKSAAEKAQSNLMNTSSFVIVSAASTIGATLMFLVIRFGMDVSDPYASKLAVTSDAYLKLRQKAVILGEDPSLIKGNALRSHKPGSYDESLIGGITSPYIRSDSNRLRSSGKLTSQLSGTLNENFDVAEVVRNNGAIDANKGAKSDGGYSLDSNSVLAEQAGISEDDLNALIDFVILNPTILDKPPESSEESEYVVDIDIDDLSDENVYNLYDEIQRQLDTEEMSDDKRSMMESLLPKEKPKPIRAVNVILKIDTNNCVVPRNSNSLIGVMFRHESEAIRGASLNELDELIALRERCDGELVVEDHAEAISVADIELRESRRDEVRYYLLQRRVPAESIVLSLL